MHEALRNGRAGDGIVFHMISSRSGGIAGESFCLSKKWDVPLAKFSVELDLFSRCQRVKSTKKCFICSSGMFSNNLSFDFIPCASLQF